MAVSYTSDVDKADVGSGNDVFTSFAISGTNPAVIICCSMNAFSVSSVVLSAGLTGGTPYLVKAQTNGTTQSEIWAIPAPSGTGTITVSYSSSGNHQCCAVLLAGADQTTPAPTADAASATTSTSPLSVTPSNLTSNDVSVFLGANSVAGDAPQAQTSPQTEIFFGNSTLVNQAVGYKTGTGSVTITWSAPPTGVGVVIGARVKAAPPSKGKSLVKVQAVNRASTY